MKRASRMRAVCMGILALAAASVSLTAQQSAIEKPAAAVVTFTLDFPKSNPAHYSIAVNADGHARYECAGSVAEDSAEEAYELEFEVSPGSRERIFEWAKQAKYFAGKIDSGNNKLAFTGTKVLSYRDSQQSNIARYNYSNQEPVRQLTALFQSMAGTLEYGWRLTYYHQYQKLALDDELKRMEAQAKSNELSEIQAIAPVLKVIVEDTSVLNVVRARAKELMEMGNPALARH